MHIVHEDSISCGMNKWHIDVTLSPLFDITLHPHTTPLCISDMELDSAHQLQVDCRQQAELAHQHGAFCADHMPVEMWWEVFQYLDDYDPVLRMSFSFWKLVTVPSVCKLWHTMLLGERKMHKAQLQMYMRIRPLPDDVLSITVPKGMLAEPWLSRYVRNIEAPISKGSVLQDFISTMLSGGTTQTDQAGSKKVDLCEQWPLERWFALSSNRRLQVGSHILARTPWGLECLAHHC